MARENSNTALKAIGAVVAVIGVGIGAGYVIGGAHSARPGSDVTPVQQQAVPAPAPTASSPKPPLTPRPTNGDYTAPNAPRIRIVEEKSPALTSATDRVRTAAKPSDSTTVPDIPTPDVEASQAPPPEPKTGDGSDQSSPTPDTTSTPTVQTAPAPTPASPPAAASGDSDFEHVGAHADPEASQAANPSDGKTQFRVQTGSFDEAQNARALADALRDRGYTTSTHSERAGGKTVYKVQVGAYRSKAAADKAAQDFQQRSGYPAYVSPTSP